MRNPTRIPCRLARRRPRALERLDPLAVSVEHVRADRALLLQGLMLAPQFVYERPERIGKGKHPARLILRRTGLQARLALIPINVPPLERQDLRLNPPAGDVREGDDRLERGRELRL